MGVTTIEWTDRSVNPIRARRRDAAHAGLTRGGYKSGIGHYCEKLSPGCANCYASKTQARFGLPAFPGAKKSLTTLPILNDRGDVPVNDEVELFFDDSVLKEVLTRRIPTKWFWCDMTDLFGSWVPDAWLDKCFAVMALTPWHTHQVLTKRIERAAEYLNGSEHPCGCERGGIFVGGQERYIPCSKCNGRGVFPSRSERVARLVMQFDRSAMLDGQEYWNVHGTEPNRDDAKRFQILPNIWLATSVEDRKRKARIDVLRNIPAAVRFLSVEPLLEDVGDLDLTGIDWVIVGGESGPGARPMHPDWARSIRDQCQAAGVPFFFKQWGNYLTFDVVEEKIVYTHGADVRCPANPLHHDWPDGRVALAVGKKAAGRLLDGRTWDEMPGTVRAENASQAKRLNEGVKA